VITNATAGNARVNALVFIDAFIPDIGENILQLTAGASLVSQSLEVKPFRRGLDTYLRQDAFREVFAADVPPKAAAVMAAAQPPLAFVLAERAGSTTVEVKSSHVVMISHPGAVTKLVATAAEANT
jgi:hypothetical protein